MSSTISTLHTNLSKTSIYEYVLLPCSMLFQIFQKNLYQPERLLPNNLNANRLELPSILGKASELVKILIDPSFSIGKLGSIMNQGWSYKKQLSSNVSNKKINDCYSMAKSCGALGGKISGAGGGGFLLIIAEKSTHTNIIQKMSTLGLMRYKFGLDSIGSVVYEIN